LKNIGISSGSGMNVYWTEYAKNWEDTILPYM
jgi:hypothetical protein